MRKKILFIVSCLFSLNSNGQKIYTFSYDSHGNRTVLTEIAAHPPGNAMSSEELSKHFKLRSVAKNVYFLQFDNIDKNSFQWIYIYDPNGRLFSTPERYDSGCLVNLQNATATGIYVIIFSYDNFVYSYKISVI